MYLPNKSDVKAIKSNLVVLVSRVLCDHMKVFKSQKGSVAKHIPHPHSTEMATKSDVVVCDVLHKNENKRVDMIDMMSTQDYLGKDFKHTVASGGDLLTVERQQGARRHLADADTPEEGLDHLEPVAEDWPS